MLIAGERYLRNDGQVVRIGGRIRDYSDEHPYVWSIQGDWYLEGTGQFVGYDERQGRFLYSSESWRSLLTMAPVQGAFVCAGNPEWAPTS